MKRVWVQCVKELRQFMRDKLTVALAIILPFISLLVYGFGTRLEIKNIPLVVQNFDNSLLSYELVDRLYSNDQFVPVKWNGRDVLKEALDTGAAEAGVIIPPEFARMVKSGRGASVQALIDGTDVNNARVIKNGIIATTNAFLQANKLSSVKQIVFPDIRLWFNPGRKESLYVVPGVYGIVLWIYPSLLAALAMARENEQGTILQAYTSSITAQELVAGKCLAYLFVGIAIALFIIILGNIIFGILPASDITPFILGTLLYLVDAALFGILIGAGASSQSAAVQSISFGGFTTALLLSGYLYPVRNIPFPLSLLSNIIPARYYITLARDTFVRGSGWVGLWHIPIILMIFAFIFFKIATKKLHKMQLPS